MKPKRQQRKVVKASKKQAAPATRSRHPAARVKKPRTKQERKERLRAILRRLDKDYPNANCALHHGSAWQLLVATILSAQCTDARVNKVTPGLFAKYPTPNDFAVLKQEVLERDIQSTGFFRNKARSLIGAAQKILSEHKGEVPDTLEQLIELPGVARKTANVVLGTWFGKATGVVVDTHVQRIARRLDLTKQTDANKVEKDLMESLPKDKWVLFAHQIIHHGRKVCIARKPRCAECSLEDLCYSTDKTV